jgi:hypothetical protein
VYFAVDDADAATEKAKEGGATVRAEPFDNEAGRFAVLTDPHGAAFALINQGGGEVAGADEEEEPGEEDDSEEQDSEEKNSEDQGSEDKDSDEQD